MENSSLTNTGTTPTTNFLSSTGTTATSTASNVGGFFSNFDWKMWLLLIFILAFLGFNIFTYLAQGTQTIADISKPITSLFATITKNITNVAATGTQAGVNAATGVVNTGLNKVKDVTDGNPNTTLTSNSSSNITNDTEDDQTTKDELNKALSNATTSKPDDIPGDRPTYEADDSYSVIQASKSSGKSGWCYIGEDRGFRTCIEVGENDRCMSGDIFPNKDVCVNPRLRA